MLAERALAAATCARTGLTYLFERTTGDDPFRRDPRRGTAGAASCATAATASAG